MTPYYSDDLVTLYHGSSLQVLSEMDSGSVDCIVTSPPYFGLRDYGVDGQIGAEPSPAEFVAALMGVFREARRVLADDGTLWLNLGDSYTQAKGQFRTGHKSGSIAASKSDYHRDAGMRATNYVEGIPPKNLLGIPWRVAFALQDDGWILRNDIIWSKPNAMPESVTDRLSNRHEHLFMFSKSRRYWFDLDAIREPQSAAGLERSKYPRTGHAKDVYGDGIIKTRNPRTDAESAQRALDGFGRNPGDVWTIATQPFSEAHFAVYPLALPERCIQAGCKPGGTVLDPFSGSGTTGLAAAKHGRRYVGIDLNRDYLDLSLRTRLQQPGLDLEGLTA